MVDFIWERNKLIDDKVGFFFSDLERQTQAIEYKKRIKRKSTNKSGEVFKMKGIKRGKEQRESKQKSYHSLSIKKKKKKIRRKKWKRKEWVKRVEELIEEEKNEE